MRSLFCALALLALAACSSREVVVVYSPHGVEMLRDYEALFEAAHPGIELRWLDLGSQEVYAKIKNEARRPAADVWWGAPSTMFSQAADEGLLEAYRPDWAEAVPEGFRDPEDRWYATYRSPLAIVYNTRGMNRGDAPQTWDALLEPEWHGRLTFRRPLPSGTMRTFICAMIDRAPDEDAGVAWLRALHEATASYPESPNLLYDHLRKNEDRVSVWLQPDIVMQRDRNGFPFGYVLPPQTPVLTDAIAIVKNGPNPEGARKFYDFVTTREALIQQANAYAKMPARADIPPETLPEWMTEQELDPMPIDWTRFAEKESGWVRRWEQEVFAAR